MVQRGLSRSFAKCLDGMELGVFARWFDNNTFCCKPAVERDLREEKLVTSV